ncbi:MAG: sensor histidine kinase [Thermomicrobiales bacterium]|nr:sensor histidine kinase [Thermomicrobiales bacterium]
MTVVDQPLSQALHTQRIDSRAALQLSGVPLLAARGICVVLAIAAIWLSVLRSLTLFHDNRGSWLNTFFNHVQVQQALDDKRVYAALTALAVLFVMRLIVLLLCAAMIVRRCRELIAFVVAALLISAAGADYPPNYFAMLDTHPAHAYIGLAIDLCFMFTLVTLFYIFPDGRFVPGWTTVPSALWLGVLIWTFFITKSLEGTSPLVALAPPIILIPTAIGAQSHRYRRMASLVERQQIKWFLGSLGIFLFVFISGNMMLGIVGGFDADASSATVQRSWLLFEIVATAATLCVPIGVVIAVLRFRLFTIDVILNRALIYGGLSVAIVGLYAGIVGYLGTLFRSGGNLAISLVATTIVALAFQPIRNRLQLGANRLLYGRRDDPYAVLVQLGQRLGETLAPETILPTIAETVREALRLPYAAVALDRDGQLVTVSSAGTPAPIAMNLPLMYQHERVGALLLAPRVASTAFDSTDLRLLNDLAHQSGVAVYAVRLNAELQRARERLVTTREEERRRLRRDLHDGLGPTLGGLALKLDVAETLIEHDPVKAQDLVRSLREQVQEATVEIRRLVYLLRPPAIDDLGLIGALRTELARYDDATMSIELIAPTDLPALPAAVEVAAYRIVQEAVTNAVRHAEATHCHVRIGVDEAALYLIITDNGCGLSNPGGRNGVGLVSMNERSAELGGSIDICAAEGGGTCVKSRLPFAQDRA